MKARPRQIDQNKPFACIDNVEKFLQAEGQEHEAASTSTILTPDMLAAQGQQNKVQQQAIPKKTVAPTIVKNLNYPQPEYFRYSDGPYPNANKYELNEMDIQFLQVFNQKLKQHNINIQVKQEELEAFMELLDSKSGKYIILDYDALLKQFNEPLPDTIAHLEYNQQMELYNHWKKYREDLGRTLMRSIMYPDLQDQNPHLAFRPRVAPTDRTMKLRRGNQNQGRGQTDWDNMAQKVISLKSEFNQAQHLLKLLIVRDQGIEISRRVAFSEFEKKYQNELNPPHSRDPKFPPEISSFSESCFVKKRDPSFSNWMDQLIKETNDWHKYYSQTKDQEEVDPVFKRLQLAFGTITVRPTPPQLNQETLQHITPNYPPPPKQKIQKDDEYIEDKRESVTKFISTLYLEAKKFNLTFDRILNQTNSLANFVPQTTLRHPAQQFPVPTTEPIPQPPQSQAIPKRPQMIPYLPFWQKKANLIYRIPLNNDLLQSYKLIEYPSSSTLQGQHVYFKEKAQRILSQADMDGQLSIEGNEEDKHDDEELKQLRKKIKLSQTKSLTISHQSSKVK